MSVRIVTEFISCMTAVNQLPVRFSLKRLRVSTATSAAAGAPGAR